jgi:hypothetical protein
MGRVTENGTYVNLVRKGAYPGVEGDAHMREIEGEQAEKLTYFTYYQIDAFLLAAGRCGLDRDDIADVFFRNASALLGVR